MNFTVVTFADATHFTYFSQLCYIIGLLIGEVKNGSPFHIFQWSSDGPRRSAQSLPAAEILAANEDVEETVILKEVMTTVLEKKSQVHGVLRFQRSFWFFMIKKKFDR